MYGNSIPKLNKEPSEISVIAASAIYGCKRSSIGRDQILSQRLSDDFTLITRNIITLSSPDYTSNLPEGERSIKRSIN